MTEEQEDVRDALRRMYGLDFTYLDTILLPELMDHVLHVFAIHGHPEAAIVYGWSFERDDAVQYFSFLHPCFDKDQSF
jgi:hypothetical protein